MAIKEVTYLQYICDAPDHDQQSKVLKINAGYTLLRNLADGTEKLVCGGCRPNLSVTELLKLIGVTSTVGKVPSTGLVTESFPIAGDKSAG
jgi:hypothetical protein